MFETLFSDVLNSEHELFRAARLIDWDNLHDALSMYYSPVGRHEKPIRLSAFNNYENVETAMIRIAKMLQG